MINKKPYCLKCSGIKFKGYSINLCEKHYNEQYQKEEEECKNKDANGNACWNCEMGNGIENCGTAEEN